ncbi:putative primosomal protein N' [Mycobacterium kansasii]|uniref:Putative primosomal protein N n=1 Tax=Mycobacterium kansasii TaxID=1768 RepID=A0A1V3WFJ6_MYCKA|nr:putative primosomal protein N' [Mycobacterium kansasii]
MEREPGLIADRPDVDPVDPAGWQVYGRGGQFLAALAQARAAARSGRCCRGSGGRIASPRPPRRRCAPAVRSWG